MVTERIRDFLRAHRSEHPYVVVDLDVIRTNFVRLSKALPESRIYYAVKANPAPEILHLLTTLGAAFDAASLSEIEMVLAAGAPADRISFGNTIKKERDIAAAYGLGVRMFAVDSCEEVDKIARVAPSARVFCRILTDGAGAEWPLSRKFGCTPAMAVRVMRHADAHGLAAHGVSFHVGSQQPDPHAWDSALKDAAHVFRRLADHGITLKMVNMGGGFPARYLKEVPAAQDYGKAIFGALRRHFGNRLPETIIEPGRGLVGDAGVIKAEVVLVSRKSDDADAARWVYLDIGKFGGLAETMDEAIRYPIRTARDGERTGPCIIAGPTCDSADVLYENTPYELPVSLTIGDEIWIEATGAYTTTYAANGFNGFAPLKSYVI